MPLVVSVMCIDLIDIDSETLDAFGVADERFLEEVNAEVAKLFFKLSSI